MIKCIKQVVKTNNSILGSKQVKLHKETIS